MSTPTAIVTATLNDPSGTPLQGNSFLRFRLRNYQGFAVQVSTYAILAELQYDAVPNSSGQISQAVIPNNDITPATTFYTVEAWNQGRILWSANYLINGATNLNTAAQLNTPAVPPGFLLVLQNNGANNSSQSLLNLENTDGSITITDMGSGTLNITGAGGGGGALKRWPGNWIGFNAAAVVGEGVLDGNIGTTCTLTGASGGALISPTATQPKAVNQNAQSIGILNSYGLLDTNLDVTTGILEDWLAKAALVGSTASRYWIGLSDQAFGAVATVFNTDTPAANFVGFRWSSTTDTNIVAICQTSSSTQTVVSTGVAFSSTPLLFEIVPLSNGTIITFYINGVLVATISTNVPATTVPLGSIIMFDGKNNGGTNAGTNTFYWYALLNA